MEYRILPHGGEKISVIGLGSGSLAGLEKEMADIIDTAIQNGINYFDIAPSEQAPFFAYAKAFDGRREQIITHHGSCLFCLYGRGKRRSDLFPRYFGNGPDVTAAAEVAAGEFQDFFATCARGNVVY